MDYSSSGDDSLDTSDQTFEEPEMVDESFEDTEPDFTEPVQESPAIDDAADDQPAADDDVSHHAKLDGIEVPGSPETEALEIPVTREPGVYGEGESSIESEDTESKDFGMHGEGPGGGMERMG
jgi:hypothetical protein